MKLDYCKAGMTISAPKSTTPSSSCPVHWLDHQHARPGSASLGPLTNAIFGDRMSNYPTPLPYNLRANTDAPILLALVQAAVRGFVSSCLRDGRVPGPGTSRLLGCSALWWAISLPCLPRFLDPRSTIHVDRGRGQRGALVSGH